MVLQSIAWTRMLVANAHGETLAVAVSKTFDGKHPCKMCHQIREGRERERHEPTVASHGHEPRMWLAVAAVPLGHVESRAHRVDARASIRPAEIVGAPPEPPPRAA
jgi:hypothetical protein